MGRSAYSERLTVEDCPSISVVFLRKQYYLHDNSEGFLYRRVNGKLTKWLAFQVSLKKNDEHIFFTHSFTDPEGWPRTRHYKILLTSTPCYFGGRRWWFVCPLSVNKHSCGRRIGILYFGNNRLLGCRHCHDLTYTSSKDSHRFDKFCLRMNITERTMRKLFRSKHRKAQQDHFS